MGEQTTISWTDHTFNPWEGCTKISPGCAHCYAEARNHRFGLDNWGKGKPRRRTSQANWRQPLKWNRGKVICLECGEWHGSVIWNDVSVSPHLGYCRECQSVRPMICRRPRVFCASLADWLDDEVPIEWLADLLKLIHDTPNLDWLLLTKRPQNWSERMESVLASITDGSGKDGEFWQWLVDWLGRNERKAPKNVWLGVSVEDQQRADERIPELLKIPARIRFLSVEPMLGPIDLGFCGELLIFSTCLLISKATVLLYRKEK